MKTLPERKKAIGGGGLPLIAGLLILLGACSGKTTTVTEPTAPPAAEDRVVARIGERKIFESGIRQMIALLPAEARDEYSGEDGLDSFTRRYVIEEVLFKKAQEAGTVLPPERQGEEESVRRHLLINAYLEKLAAPRVKIEPGEMEKFYEHSPRLFSQPNQAKVRKIKTATEEKTKEVLARLEKGEDFSRVAADASEDKNIDEIADDWGYVGGMGNSEELTAAIFALKPGEFTKTPLKHGNDYYVFQMTELMPAPNQGFAAVKDRVESVYRGMKLSGEKRKGTQEILKEAGVEFYPLAGQKK